MITAVSLRHLRAGIATLLFVSGCTALHVQDQGPGQTAIPVLLPEAQQLQALQDEGNEEYLEAHSYWVDARARVDDKIETLSVKLEQISQTYLQEAVELYESGKRDEALSRFIEALRYNPDNSGALDYLKNKYTIDNYLSYTVQTGDTLSSIAESVYGSSSYLFMTLHFSDNENKRLSEGLVLSLADLGSFSPRALDGYKRDMLAVRKLFKAGDFPAALQAARLILANHPGDEEASYIINMSLLGIARDQRENEEFEEAITTLTQVDPAFRKVNKQIQDIRSLQIEKQLEAAEYSDDKLLQMANDLYDQGNYLKARAVLQQTGQDFAGRDEAFARIQQKLDQQAESHYKTGVKYFVEEKLEEAIAEWEETLRLNPEHRNARISLKQARDLLDKYKKIN